jgi:two-component system chemotaxis sensor kinase CheA
MDDLLVDFLTETNESLAELDVALIKLERMPDDRDTISRIFRLLHTIKGTCGFLGLARLERVAHAGENVLGRVRDGKLAATPTIVSLVLAALDRIKQIASALTVSGTEPAGDDQSLIDQLNAAAEVRAPVDKPEADEETPAPSVVAEPSAVEAVVAEATVASQTIRVTVDVLEDLMTLVSELVLTRNQLLQLARSQESSPLAAPLQRLSQITSDLQEGVMKTRMQPIGNAWNKLPRLVRELGRELNKKIDLVMLGAETELDRQVLELIKDPLTHMVRNSADHGLETPAQRRAAGKSETGRMTLNAFHEGGHIIIEIGDDGRGLSVDRIRAKVLANGLATETELAAMSDSQIHRFIFRPGFSTAAEVTAVSGRGVGMDVVKTNIERIGGTVDLKSVAGQGTTFSIKIPLTLAIISALIVEAAGERFAIPQINVIELVQARQGGGQSDPVIERINDTPVLRLRDRLLPLVNLNDLLQLGSHESAEQGVTIVVSQVGTQMLGIVVDRVFDTEEIVVKPVAPILRDITMFGGNTILGDGSVIMILDPNGIARASGMDAGGDSRTLLSATSQVHRSSDKIPMLLFRAGGRQPLAVPLGLVARLEEVPRERIEFSSGALVTQYRGQLMPLLALSPDVAQSGPSQPVLVFCDAGRSMGLMVDEIVDVVEDQLHIELSAARPGLLGSAVVAGLATDIIDTGFWLTQAWQDWFGGRGQGLGRRDARRVLVIDDSQFFRQLLVPTLAAAGYDVTTAGNAGEALKLRDAGVNFDAIVCDIEMPDMDGLSFARAVRAGGNWAVLPMIALSARAEAHDIEAGRDAGFTDYVAKFQRETLVASLRECLWGINQT